MIKITVRQINKLLAFMVDHCFKVIALMIALMFLIIAASIMFGRWKIQTDKITIERQFKVKSMQAK